MKRVVGNDRQRNDRESEAKNVDQELARQGQESATHGYGMSHGDTNANCPNEAKRKCEQEGGHLESPNEWMLRYIIAF